MLDLIKGGSRESNLTQKNLSRIINRNVTDAAAIKTHVWVLIVPSMSILHCALSYCLAAAIDNEGGPDARL